VVGGLCRRYNQNGIVDAAPITFCGAKGLSTIYTQKRLQRMASNFGPTGRCGPQAAPSGCRVPEPFEVALLIIAGGWLGFSDDAATHRKSPTTRDVWDTQTTDRKKRASANDSANFGDLWLTPSSRVFRTH